MSNAADKKIAEILAKFGEPMDGNVWRVQGTPVIYHKTLERIAVRAKITFDMPQILRAERDEAVILLTGRLGNRPEWSIGEALIGANYRVSGKQAAYPYAMAEKRAKDRVILKLIDLHGLVYSETEADEFSEARPSLTQSSTSSEGTASDQYETRQGRISRELRERIAACKSPESVTALMLGDDTKQSLSELSDTARDEIRNTAAERFHELNAELRRKA